MTKALILDIGATNLRVSIATDSGSISVVDKINTKDLDSEHGLDAEITKHVSKDSALKYLGISVAGPVRDNMSKLTNIATKPVVDIRQIGRKFLKGYMLNDAEAAVYGLAQNLDCNNLVFITISSGIGVGVVSKGEIVHFNQTSEELGHIVINSDFTLSCACGGKNHWESYSSGINLPKFYHQWSENYLATLTDSPKDSKEIFDRAQKGDKVAKKFLVEGFGAINSQAIEKIIDKFSPTMIVFGGPVVLENREVFISSLSDKIKKSVKIIFSDLGDEVSVIGMAKYVFDNI